MQGSLRSGFATTAAEFGAEERNIMAMTGHKTTRWLEDIFRKLIYSKIML